MLRPILIATLVARTLDILSAFVFAGMAAMSPGGTLFSHCILVGLPIALVAARHWRTRSTA